VKLKSLLVITLLVIGCSFASAQAGTFGFGTAGGDYLYCNYIQLSNYSGAVWQGTDNLSACAGFVGFNATVAGVTGKLAKASNPFVGATINGVTYADNLYDAYGGFYDYAQWDVRIRRQLRHPGLLNPWKGHQPDEGSFDRQREVFTSQVIAFAV
jgi:hypothetical protein